MSIYKAIIVDDEYWARMSLKEKLIDFPEIEIIGEASNIPEAKQEIEKLQLDINQFKIFEHGETKIFYSQKELTLIE